MKLILVADESARSAIVRILLKNVGNVEIVLVNKEDELPEDIEQHIHPSRFPKLSIDPTLNMVQQRPIRNVRPNFANKVSDRYPKSNKRDRFPFSKRK